ncbi:MAG TPA: acetyl-CoA carboxylase carboxyl transferase subunit alpha [Candidatus Spyradocola merdavium]|nr:acetyl-CoA carboxylase carboxyl transferase subunit alpha [Candidatus Spyradocola merdavium]
MTAYERLCAARAKGRPTSRKYIDNIFDSFFELHGDRFFADDLAVRGGIAELNGRPVTVVSMEKGEDTKEKIARNFGSPNPEGYRKALRLMKQAEKFHRPVVCFVDTAGAYCGLGAEERGQASAIAANLMEMMGLKTPILSLLIGEGGSGGALALAVADEVWMMENAVYSVISPEGGASILYKDATQVERAAEELRITAQDLYGFGVVERVISEAEGFDAAYRSLRDQLDAELNRRMQMDVQSLLCARYERFRKIGGLME